MAVCTSGAAAASDRNYMDAPYSSLSLFAGGSAIGLSVTDACGRASAGDPLSVGQHCEECRLSKMGSGNRLQSKTRGCYTVQCEEHCHELHDWNEIKDDPDNPKKAPINDLLNLSLQL